MRGYARPLIVPINGLPATGTETVDQVAPDIQLRCPF